MKYPKEVKAFCSHCNAHTPHKVKVASKGKARTLAKGQRSHVRKLEGHGGKRAGKVSVKKQGQHQKLMMECSQCKKKQERLMGGRSRKKIEIQK